MPFNGTQYLIRVTVSDLFSADTVISIEAQDGGSSEPNVSTSLLYIYS